MKSKSLAIILFSFFTIFLIGGIVMAQDIIPPTVVSTSPTNGAVNVSVNLAALSITFSEPMSLSFSYSTDWTIWGASPPPPIHSWSQGDTVLTFSRNPAVALPVGVTITFTINNLRDKAGNPLSPNPYIISFLVGTSVDLPPSVLSTVPANGATGVSRDLQTVSITFSEPMNPGILNMSSNFPSFNASWSDYNRVLRLTRTDTQTPLKQGANYVFNLNPPGGNIMCDTQGNSLPPTTFSFQTQQEFQLLKISENPIKGFHWPYYLLIPNNLSPNTVLLVETNNTGTTSDDIAVHDAAAESLIRFRSDFAIDLDVPILVPTFPRPSNPGYVYTHALDRYSLLTDAIVGGKSIRRIDLQLIAMIADARARLVEMGFVVDKRIFMHGFSASGAFTSRFSLLHPGIIKAAAPGSPGGWPTAPVSSWNIPSYGVTTLRYPVGVADVESLTGRPFTLEAYRKVPHYIYVGDIDNNDALDTRGCTTEERTAICSWLNCDPFPWIADRWPISESIYDFVDADAQFVIYPRVGHTITDQMFANVKTFFSQHRLPIVTEAQRRNCDFNGDGETDMAGLTSTGLIFYTTNRSTWRQIPGRLDQLVVGDFDGDGLSDLAGLTSDGLIFYTTDRSTWTQIPGVLEQLFVGDFNGDGISDLAGLTSNGLIFYTTNRSTWTQIPGVLEQLVVGDFNNDGRSDLAGLTANGLIFYTTNLSTWTQIPGVLDQLVVGDFNNDGRSDLAGLTANGLIFYTTNLSTWTQIPGVLDKDKRLVVGDFNRDGSSDLAGLTTNGLIFYTTNRSTWTQIPGVLDQLVAGDFDGNGSFDLSGRVNGLIFYTTNLSTWTQIPGVLRELAQ